MRRRRKPSRASLSRLAQPFRHVANGTHDGAVGSGKNTSPLLDLNYERVNDVLTSQYINNGEEKKDDKGKRDYQNDSWRFNLYAIGNARDNC